MWSQYDENLSVNPFFKEINEYHSDILQESALQNWIICVPRFGSIDPSEISTDTILDHILVIPAETKENHYYTLSKKQISVQIQQIFLNLDNVNSSIDILFEETFYINKISKFIVWCIDRPLFLKHKFCDSHSSKSLSTLHDCIDFLWCESLSHNVLDSLKNLVYNFSNDFELEIESLQTQKEIIGRLFSQCLQICFKNEVLKDKSMISNQFLENLKVAVETYMQYCLGKKFMISVNTITHQKDAYLNKTIRNCLNIQYQDLGIAQNFADVILTAKNELNQINTYWTILDKMHCLKKTLNIIFESGKNIKTNYITSDDVLQILAFIILKLNINNWYSNLTYLNEFQFSTTKSDQTEFCISSLEAAVEFISSSKFWEIKNNIHHNLEAEEIAVNFIEKKIKSAISDNLSSVAVLSENDLMKDMCHPLCECTKCLAVQRKSKTLVDTGIPSCELNESLLIFATCLGNSKVVDFLLTRRIDINFSDCFGKTSLHYAASKGLQNILLLLLNKKANVNIVDNEKNTPLHLASLNGHESCVKALIYSTAAINLNIGNLFGDTPLILAAKWGYYEIVKILLENGSSVIVKNKRNQSIFDVSPNLYILRLCEKYSVCQHAKTKKTVQLDNISIIRNEPVSCNSHGIRPKSTDEFKKIDLLLKSIENNDLPLTCFYLGYSNNSQTVEGGICHPLCVCDKCKNEELDDIKQEKTNSSININMCDASGYTPLHTAAKFGRTEILRLLLDSGSLPNVKTYKTLYTALHLACIKERIQIVRELLKCGNCKVDEQDAKGNTPLYYACTTGNAKIVEILLSSGADSNKKNFFDKSALTQSEENMQYGIFKLLKNNNSGLNKNNKDIF